MLIKVEPVVALALAYITSVPPDVVPIFISYLNCVDMLSLGTSQLNCTAPLSSDVAVKFVTLPGAVFKLFVFSALYKIALACPLSSKPVKKRSKSPSLS